MQRASLGASAGARAPATIAPRRAASTARIAPTSVLRPLVAHRHVAASAVPSSSSPSSSSPASHPHGHGAHGHGHGERPRPGEKKGFVEEMRFVAMKLHTKDQAPKEGGREAAETPWAKWRPTREGYLRFLSESKLVYEALEDAVRGPDARPEYAAFRDTGLERSEALEKDVQWFEEKYGLVPPAPSDDGPGARYAAELRRLAREDPQAFICHFYNVYFAHTAGGRMIGVKMADMLLERHALEFYKYPKAEGGDHRPLLEKVRASLDAVAEGWTREEKDRCLAETEESFKMSGALLRSIAEPVGTAS